METGEAKLDLLKAARSGKWDTFKTDIEGAWGELETVFRKLAS